MTIDCLPREILASTLNYLDLPNFLNCTRVSKSWQSIQNIDSIWKKYCQELLASAQPLNNSWRERMTSYINMRQGRFNLTDLDAFRPPVEYALNFDFNDLNEPICVFSSCMYEETNYFVKNMATNAIFHLDFGSINEHVIASDIFGQHWYALTNMGVVFVFNLSTCKLCTRIETNRDAYLHIEPFLRVNSLDIIYVYDGGKVKWIDKKTMQENVHVVDDEILQVLGSTHKSIYFSTFKHFPVLNEFVKLDKVSRKEEILYGLKALAVTPDGNKVLELSSEGVFTVTSHDGIYLVRVGINDFAHWDRMSVKVYGEWVAFAGRKFVILNHNTGKKICSINLSLEDFRFNYQGILTEFSLEPPRSHYPKNCKVLRLCDFTKGNTMSLKHPSLRCRIL